MKKKFKDLLHHYKVEAFKVAHNTEHLEEVTKEILNFTDEAFNNAYHFHFHEDPDPRQIESFNRIKHFTLEALLPPVVEKIMRRVVVLEKQHQQLVELFDQILEVLSEDGEAQSDANVG